MLNSLFLFALAAAQPAQEPVAIRPGTRPEGVSAVPLTETAEPLGLAIAGFDADQDGVTTRAEYDAALVRSFAAADTNGDGVHGYIEYSGWAARWLGSQNALPGPFQIDADGDNRISREEFMAEFGRQFARLDANGDGAITRAELLVVRHPRMQPLRDRSQDPPLRPRGR